LAFKNGNQSFYSYKHSNFRDLFIEIFKIKAQSCMDGKYYDEAFNEYLKLNSILPDDSGK